MLAVDELASVVGKSTNSNVTFSAVVFSTSYVSNVVNGTLDDAISATVNASLVVLSVHGKNGRLSFIKILFMNNCNVSNDLALRKR